MSMSKRLAKFGLTISVVSVVTSTTLAAPADINAANLNSSNKVALGSMASADEKSLLGEAPKITTNSQLRMGAPVTPERYEYGPIEVFGTYDVSENYPGKFVFTIDQVVQYEGASEPLYSFDGVNFSTERTLDNLEPSSTITISAKVPESEIFYESELARRNYTLVPIYNDEAPQVTYEVSGEKGNATLTIEKSEADKDRTVLYCQKDGTFTENNVISGITEDFYFVQAKYVDSDLYFFAGLFQEGVDLKFTEITGTVTISEVGDTDGKLTVGDTLQANFEGNYDESGELSYDWITVENGIDSWMYTSETNQFTIDDRDAGNTIKVEVRSSKDSGKVVSAETVVISDGIERQEKPEKVVIKGYDVDEENKNRFKLEVVEIEGCEYSLNGKEYQNSNVFRNLMPESTVTVYARYKATEELEESESTESESMFLEKLENPFDGEVNVSESFTNSVGGFNKLSLTLTATTEDTSESLLGFEYNFNNEGWTDKNVIEGLRPETTVEYKVRCMETPIYKAKVVAEKTIKVPAITQGNIIIDGEVKVGSTLTATLEGETDKTSYRWVLADENGMTGDFISNEQSLTIIDAYKGKNIYALAFDPKNLGYAISENIYVPYGTEEDKGAQIEVTYGLSETYSEKFALTIKEIEGAEYSFDGETFTSNRVVDNLEIGSELTCYVKLADGKVIERTITLEKLANDEFIKDFYIIGGTPGDRTLTIKEDSGIEYKVDGGEWTSEPLTGIKEDKITILAKYKETATHRESYAKQVYIDLEGESEVEVDDSYFKADITLVGETVVGNTIEAKIENSNSMGNLHWIWYLNDEKGYGVIRIDVDESSDKIALIPEYEGYKLHVDVWADDKKDYISSQLSDVIVGEKSEELKTQEVKFAKTEVTKTYGDEAFTNAAQTTGDGVITYTSSDKSVATVDKTTGEVTILKAGEAVITAVASETDTYAEATVSYNLVVEKATITITANGVSIKVGDIEAGNIGEFNYTVSGLVNGEELIREPRKECTTDIDVDGTCMAGEYTIFISGAEAPKGDNYNPIVYKNGTLTITNKEVQEVKFAEAEITKTYGDEGFTNVAQTTGDGVITYTSSDESVATVDETTGEVTKLKAGNAVITAVASETDTYAEATASYNLVVEKATITITADSYTIKVKDKVPLTYTVIGLVNGDELTTIPLMNCCTNYGVAGEYAINIGYAEAPKGDNYNPIVYKDGILTVIEDKPSTGEDKPSTGEDKPSTGEDKPSTGEDKPSTGEDKPSTGEDKPSTGEDKPSTGEDKPSIGEDKPSTGEDKPSTGEDKPSTGEDKPSTGEDKPSTGEDKPSTDDKKPSGGYSFDRHDHYKVIEGAKQVITGSTDASFELNMPYYRVLEVFVNNELVSKDNYDVEGYRAEVVLKGSYLDTLANGTYKLKVKTTDRRAVETTFTINRPEAKKIRFIDVVSTDWFHDSVYDTVDKGLLTGTSENRFSPYANTTRAMVWTVIARMNNMHLEGSGVWYEASRVWAMNAGITDGYNPNANITREQFVTMLYRNAGEPQASGRLTFADNNKVSKFAEKAVIWATENGIIKGKDKNRLDPKGQLTRAEMAAILSRFTK